MLSTRSNCPIPRELAKLLNISQIITFFLQKIAFSRYRTIDDDIKKKLVGMLE